MDVREYALGVIERTTKGGAMNGFEQVKLLLALQKLPSRFGAAVVAHPNQMKESLARISADLKSIASAIDDAIAPTTNKLSDGPGGT